MSGIYGSFLKKSKHKNLYSNFSNFNLNSIKNEIIYKDITLGRCVLNKNHNDRFFDENDDFIVCFEGINYTKELRTIDDFIKSYKKEGLSFVKRLKGCFSGFLLDKQEEKIFIFNDHLASRSIFYYFSPEEGFIFSSELKLISKLMSTNGIHKNLDLDGVYLLALYGHLLDDITILEEVKRLPYSSIITYDINAQTCNVDSWFKYSKEKKSDMTLDEAIKGIDELMVSAIREEWNKDIEYGKKHFSLLSGGMDAKTNVLIAKSLGFSKMNTLTFGQSKSSDVKIAEDVSVKNGFDHTTMLLDNGNYLVEDTFKKYISVTDGLMMFHTSSHMQSSIEKVNFEDFAVLHSGQIGDLLFGSFIKRNGYNLIKNKDSIGYTGFIRNINALNKITKLDLILERYSKNQDYELYTYEQRVNNAVTTGDRAVSNWVDHVSPFYDKKLIEFCLTIPDEFKINESIYFKWLAKKHPNVLQFKWDKIEMAPTNSFKIKYGKIFKKYYNGAKKYFKWNYESMTPFSKWIKTNPAILENLNTIFNSEINKIENLELKNDLETIFKADVFEYRNKFAVVTTLLAIKMHYEV